MNLTHQPPVSRSGFSLVEMLAVVAVIGVLSALGVGLVNMGQRQHAVRAGAEEVASILKFARWEARSKSTYTFVCFKNSEEDGRMEVMVLTSLDGSSNSDPDNLALASPLRQFRGVSLDETGGRAVERLVEDYEAAGMDPDGMGRLGGATTVVEGPGGRTFSGTILSFSPQGTPLIPGAQTPTNIELLFSPEGDQNDPDKSAAIAVTKSTGLPQTFY